MNIQLSVIIVNYNGMRFLDGCFTSLYDKLSTLSYEIIVIDNNSTDESCNYIKDNHSKVHLIDSKINYGFGKGNNEAVKHAKGNTILLLNNDTILLDKIDELVVMLEKDATIGVIGINMVDANHQFLPSYGNFPSMLNMLYMKNIQNICHDLKTGNFSQKTYSVDWIGGAFMLIKKQLYDDIKGFDEDYFMYVEDVDLCKKIEKKGLKRMFIPSFNYVHFVGFSKARNPLLIKGYELFIEKHLKGWDKIKCLFSLKTNKIVKLVKHKLN
jgi:GT2 family glycosyltransferase